MPISSSVRRRRPTSRPFFLSTFAITLIATYALFLRDAHPGGRDAPRSLHSRSTEPQCDEIHYAEDQCSFARTYCKDDEAGLLPYLTFYYCTLGHVRPVAFILLVMWLGLLFTTIGIAASDFFSVNLSTIAGILGLSESLAGVTFLAFGNGSPDVFSTFAAMNSNSGSMAVGELIGAAGFITAVVAGSMALVREFKVSKRTFVRDICFFIVAVSFTMVFLADNELHLWECCVMIGFYVFYVVVVVGWHWYSARRARRRMRENASRAHFYGATAQGADELEPYRDDEDLEDTAPMGQRPAGGLDASADITALERSSLIEPAAAELQSPGDDEETHGRHVVAEMTSSMRVLRPRWGRSNTTITPIRPSLVGALEFRSVLASLQKATNMRLAPLPERSYSDNPAAGEREGLLAPANEDSETARPDGRDRALSSGNEPLHLYNAGLPQPGLLGGPPAPHEPAGSVATSADGKLAPPNSQPHHHHHPNDHLQTEPHHSPLPQTPQTSPRKNLRLQIPSHSRGSSIHSSPSLSPFPALPELPAPGGPSSAHDRSLPSVAGASRPSIPSLGFEGHEEMPKPIRWWPYRFLPAPHVLWQTIFPTLQGWKSKTFWDKFVSVISVPSIFILVTTLPVVETDRSVEEPDDITLPPPEIREPESNPPFPPPDLDVSDSHETEWQRYRRSTVSATPSQSSAAVSPTLVPVQPHGVPEPPGPELASPYVAFRRDRSRPKRPPSLEGGRSVTPIEEPENTGWNRWLVALQIFTGPLFVVCIVWANMRDDIDAPGKTLLRSVLYSLLVSLVLLTLLLTTSPFKKPKYHSLLCFLGFIISIAWISTVAGEVVGVLKAFGVILSISEAILGLTIFAVGNSLGDLVADVTVARLGYPVMALAACFGGPMLNILLGVGVGGAWMTVNAANKSHEKDPSAPMRYQPYYIHVGGTLMVSAVTVLLTLVVLLIAVPSNQWVMSRKIGWGLIAIWTVGTIINLAFELIGVWSDVA